MMFPCKEMSNEQEFPKLEIKIHTEKITFNFYHEMEVNSLDLATVGIFTIFMV